MLVIGCGGLALQILHDLEEAFDQEMLTFFDDVTLPKPDNLLGYPVINNLSDAKQLFARLPKPSFCLGLAGPANRKTLVDKFISAGGTWHSLISKRHTEISRFANIAEGVNILPYCLVEPGVQLGRGVLLNAGCLVHHTSIIGDFSELGPGVTVLGNVVIGEHVFIGAQAVIFPKITIGNNVVIGAGSVVTQDIPANAVAFGIPAMVKRNLNQK